MADNKICFVRTHSSNATEHYRDSDMMTFEQAVHYAWRTACDRNLNVLRTEVMTENRIIWVQFNFLWEIPEQHLFTMVTNAHND
jgi:hypothetical protein